MKKFLKGLFVYAFLAVAVSSSIYYMAIFFGDQTVHVAKKQWNPAKVQDQGIDPRVLKRAAEYIEARLPAARGLIIIKNGKTVLEKYYWKGGPQERDYLHSVNAVVLHALLGIAFQEHNITQDQHLSYFFPEFAKESQYVASLTVNDLLAVNVPLVWGDDQPEYWQLFYAQDKTRHSLQVLSVNSISPHPAAGFAAQYLLAEIIEKVAGVDLFQFADQQLFQPMGITTLDEAVKDKGLLNKFSGMQLKTLDLAKLGYLILNKGQWKGEQLIPQEWLSKVINVQSNKSTLVFAGWQSIMLSGVPGVVAAGEGGQYIVLVPDLDMVIAVSSKSLFPVAQNNGYDALFALIVNSVQKVKKPEQEVIHLTDTPGPTYFKPNFVFSTKVPEDIQQFLYSFARDIAENDIKKVLYHYAKGYERVDRRYLIPVYNNYKKVPAHWGKIFAGGSGVLQSVQVEKIRVDGNRAYMRGLLKHSYANMNEGSLGWFPIENLIKIRGRWLWLGAPEFGAVLDREEYFDAETTDEITQFLKDCATSLAGEANNENCFADNFIYNGTNKTQLQKMVRPFFEEPKGTRIHCSKVTEAGDDRLIEGYLAGSRIGNLQLPQALRISKNNGQWQWVGNGEAQ